MKLFGRELYGYAKTLVILVAVLLVSSGLCGLQIAINSSGRGADILAPIFMVLGVPELVAMVVSAIGIVIVLLLWIASALYARFANQEGVPPALPGWQ